MPADAGTITLLENTKFYGIQIIKVTWLAAAGNFEQDVPVSTFGRLVQIAHAPGATAPTLDSDLAVFDERDIAEAGALVTAAGDGLNLISTGFKFKAMTAPAPYVAGKVRLQVTGNVAAAATGTIYLYVEEMRRAR